MMEQLINYKTRRCCDVMELSNNEDVHVVLFLELVVLDMLFVGHSAMICARRITNYILLSIRHYPSSFTLMWSIGMRT